MKSKKNWLNNQLLIAMPSMTDPNFSHTVTLICEHSEQGALGIIINRPMDMKITNLMEQLELSATNISIKEKLILNGGPLSQERGFVLHNSQEAFQNSLSISDDVKLTLSKDIIDAISSGHGPEKSIIALGYAGWEAGQLEKEMLLNTWLSIPVNLNLIFDLPYEKRWEISVKTLGFNPNQLSTQIGHA